MSSWETGQVIEFFAKSPMLPCRAQILDKDYPVISSTLRDLPEFLLEEKCKNCKKMKKIKINKFKYKKKYFAAIGAHLTISCPESNVNDHVVWRKDNKILKPGTEHLFGKDNTKDTILVDTFSTIYFIGVTSEVKGNYTCFVNGVRMLQVKLDVMSRTYLLTHGNFCF